MALPYSSCPSKAQVAPRQLPLATRRIAVTRPRGGCDELGSLLTSLGAEVLFFPTIDILPPSDWTAADAALESLPTYEWLVFTSRNAVEQFSSRLAQIGLGPAMLSGVRVAAIGDATADALRGAGIHVDISPREALASEIPESLGAVDGARVLLPRSDIARAELPDALRARGAIVDEVTVYRTVGGADGVSALVQHARTGQLDAITFASASAVRSFADAAAQSVDLASWLHAADRPRIVVIGPVTASSARDLNIPVDGIAVDHDAHGLAQAVVDVLAPTLSENFRHV